MIKGKPTLIQKEPPKELNDNVSTYDVENTNNTN